MSDRPRDEWKVILSQVVHRDDHAGSGGGSLLYEIHWEGEWLPDVDEYVSLWPDEDGDPIGSVTNTLKRRWWAPDGCVRLELVDFHLNPSEMIQKVCDGKYRRAWWTEYDGDLDAALLAGGWSLY